MSHFISLVVVRDAKTAADAIDAAEALLMPYDENLDTIPYFRGLDQAEVDHAVAFYRENPDLCGGDSGGPTKPFDEYVTEGNLEAWHEWVRMAVGGYHANSRSDGVYDSELDRFGYMSTYNPQSKWDWYSLGGRWAGYFKVKSDAPADDWRLGNPSWGDETPVEEYQDRADVARVRAIDFEGARNLTREKAEQTFDLLESVTKDLSPVVFQSFVKEEYAKVGIDPDGWEQFLPDAEIDERRAKFNAPRDIARQRYHAHPWVVAMSEANLLGWFGNPVEDYCLDQENPRAAYVQRCIDDVFVPYAMLMDDGEWYERGQMGWFGIASNEMAADDWDAKVARLFDSLPGDAFLVAMDCHI